MIPTEGASLYEEAMCVLDSAPNKAAARQFMEFMLRPDISVKNTNQQFNGSVNIPARALVADAIKANPNVNVDTATMARLQMFEDVGAALKAYDRAWNSIRTSDLSHARRRLGQRA